MFRFVEQADWVTRDAVDMIDRYARQALYEFLAGPARGLPRLEPRHALREEESERVTRLLKHLKEPLLTYAKRYLRSLELLREKRCGLIAVHEIGRIEPDTSIPRDYAIDMYAVLLDVAERRHPSEEVRVLWIDIHRSQPDDGPATINDALWG